MWFMKIAKGRTVGKSELGLKFIAQGPGQNLAPPPIVVKYTYQKCTILTIFKCIASDIQYIHYAV